MSTGSSEITDPGLAPEGEARIVWADGQMPVLRSIRERFEEEQPLAGLTVAACLHITPETANLMRTLAAGGADVSLCAANPYSTGDDVAAALAVNHGVEVHARHGESPGEYASHVAALIDRGPEVTLDDGADLVSVLHATRPELLDGLRGGTEETTTGLVRIRAMERAGELRCPVVAVNEAGTERAFNDRYGTGQSALDGLIRATNILLAGRTLVVLGYGGAGKGIAVRAAGLGATVIVCEVEPMRALEARMDGFEVLPAIAAAAKGEVFITATGGIGALRAEHFELMKDGAVLANAGHFDVEVDLGDLERVGGSPVEVKPLVSRYSVDGKSIDLIAGGRVVNLAAAEGHPAAVMDMSFATQALTVVALADGSLGDEPGVRPVPGEIDNEVARLKLASMGVEIDSLTEDQLDYLHSWRPDIG
ncbi:MAG: adenosylhomocysteinase [Actinomycetes bacterium]